MRASNDRQIDLRVRLTMPEPPEGRAPSIDETIDERVFQELQRRRAVWGGMRGYILDALRFYEQAKLGGAGAAIAQTQMPSMVAIPSAKTTEQPLAHQEPAKQESKNTVNPLETEQVQVDDAVAVLPGVTAEPQQPVSEPAPTPVADSARRVEQTEDIEKGVEAVAAQVEPKPEPKPEPEPEMDPLADIPVAEDMFPVSEADRPKRPKPNFSQFAIGR